MSFPGVRGRESSEARPPSSRLPARAPTGRTLLRRWVGPRLPRWLHEPTAAPGGSTTDSRTADSRSALAIAAARLAGRTSRRLGIGNGSVIVGRVALALDPGALAASARRRTVALVSGTNGKTTTSHLLAGALGRAGAVAHNASGSNMADGALTALLERPDADRAVIEVDELHLAEVADAVDPAVIVLLNLTRDQLDRVAEVRGTAAAIAEVLARHRRTVVIANADDPLTTWAASAAPHVVWVSGGAAWSSDAASCPRCGELLVRGEGRWAPWHCPGCDLRRPEPTWWWEATDAGGSDGSDDSDDSGGCDDSGDSGGATGAVAHGADGWTGPLRTALPGQINLSNALVALAAADAVGVGPDVARHGVGEVSEVAGRYAERRVGQHHVRTLLVKNPAGWVEAVELLAPGRPLLVVINARQADGRDVSWLWDLPVEAVAGRPVAVAGERAADMGVRLSYAGVDHRTAPDVFDALALLPPGPVDVVANYTAFHELRGRLARVAG